MSETKVTGFVRTPRICKNLLIFLLKNLHYYLKNDLDSIDKFSNSRVHFELSTIQSFFMYELDVHKTKRDWKIHNVSTAKKLEKWTKIWKVQSANMYLQSYTVVESEWSNVYSLQCIVKGLALIERPPCSSSRRSSTSGPKLTRRRLSLESGSYFFRANIFPGFFPRDMWEANRAVGFLFVRG